MDGEVWNETSALQILHQRIPYHAIFRNIANTAKHGTYRSEGIEDLHARMTPKFSSELEAQLDAMNDEDGAMFILRHWQNADWRLTYHSADGGDVELEAMKLFYEARDAWAVLLREFGWID